MALHDTIRDDLKAAMKAGDTLTRDVLRMLDGAIGNEAIEKQKKDKGLSDDEVVAVVKRALKQRKDSIAQYRDGGRNDLAEKEEKEAAVLEKYMPAQMSEEDIEKIVQDVIAETGASSKADMGAVMGAAMQKCAGQADGAQVKEIVSKLLA